jgi:predicted metal-dependent peptidase
MAKTDMDNNKRLSKMKTILTLEHVFWGTLAMRMPWTITEEPWCPTAATNGSRVLINREYMESLTDDELLFLGCHEIGHPMLEHIGRRQGRDMETWNEACDYVLNYLLVEEHVGKMPEGGLYDRDLYNQGEGQAEVIYNILMQKKQKQPKGNGDKPCENGEQGGSGWPRVPSKDQPGPLDMCEDSGSSPAEQEQMKNEWGIAVAQAAQAARMMGKLSAGLERLVGEILNPKVPWSKELQDFFTKARASERTFARPNRRFVSQGLYTPSRSGVEMGPLIVAVDCSGSIGPDEINQFASEINAIRNEVRPRETHVVYFDSRVSHYECYEADDDLDIRPHGGGGTAFSPVFEYVEDNAIEAEAIVFLTDMYCYDFGVDPQIPVLWVSTTDRSECPFGRVIHMN